MEMNNQTAGETANMGRTAMITTVLDTIVALLVSMGTSFKKVGGEFIKEKEMKQFITTLFVLSNVGPYDTTLVVQGVGYPLESFKIDSRIASAFVQPRAILMPGTSPFRKDLSAHLTNGEAMDPATFQEFQYRFLNYFKVVPSFGNTLDAIKPMNIGEITDCMSSSAVHVEDLASTTKVPPILADAGVFFGDNYFNYDVPSVVKNVVLHFYTTLA